MQSMFRYCIIYTIKAMKTTHTPGPWRYEADIKDRQDHTTAIDFKLYGADQTEIIGGCGCCGSPFMYGPALDNARLISAAPELLEALNRLLMCPDLNLDSLETETAEAIQHAQQVIHKATNGNA